MNLSERKKKILSAVISESEKSGSPISSKRLQKAHFKEFSSATIRNELATLEELGLIYQPHTSAGRLPTIDGIKFYVEDILKSIDGKDISSVVSNFNATIDNISTELKSTARAISEATNYTSIMYFGVYDLAVIEKIKMLKLDNKAFMVAILTDRGVLEDVIDADISQDELNSSAELLTKIFEGKTLRDISNSDALIDAEIGRYRFIFDLIVRAVLNKEKRMQQIAIEGKDKIFDYPTFSDKENVKNVLQIFEEPSSLVPLLNSNENEIEVEIGANEGPIKNCAVVTASYKANGKVIGRAGVLGPIRMDYKKVIDILASISKGISQQLEKSKGGESKNRE